MSYTITDRCIGCSACSLACPVFAISGEKGQRFTINPKRCVECGVCGRTCPKDAVEDADGNVVQRVPRKEWAKPVIDTEACTACAICVTICTKNALRIAMPAFRGDIDVAVELYDSAKCVGCNLCERNCPMDAITMISQVEV
jgi:formate hydrogenlyase subunit 6/NADH:ubiquinone oxidoreductase subunit I